MDELSSVDFATPAQWTAALVSRGPLRARVVRLVSVETGRDMGGFFKGVVACNEGSQT